MRHRQNIILGYFNKRFQNKIKKIKLIAQIAVLNTVLKNKREQKIKYLKEQENYFKDKLKYINNNTNDVSYMNSINNNPDKNNLLNNISSIFNSSVPIFYNLKTQILSNINTNINVKIKDINLNISKLDNEIEESTQELNLKKQELNEIVNSELTNSDDPSEINNDDTSVTNNNNNLESNNDDSNAINNNDVTLLNKKFN